MVVQDMKLPLGTIAYWLLVSEPGFLKVLDDFGRTFKFIWKLRPRSNIV